MSDTPTSVTPTSVKYRAKITVKAESPARLMLGMTDTIWGDPRDTPQECASDIVNASHGVDFIHADVVPVWGGADE